MLISGSPVTAASTRPLFKPWDRPRPARLRRAPFHHDEAFGPVCVIATFADDDEAVALAGDTDHGLTCGILTENGTHGLAVAGRIRTGIVHINDQSVADEPQAPFGGTKASGYGRFGGRPKHSRSPAGSPSPPNTSPTRFDEPSYG
jgi:delta 1-pyrroline-5-carboxylate dehydrogenase